MINPALRYALLALFLLATVQTVSSQNRPAKIARATDEAVFVYDVFQGRPTCPEVVDRLKKLPLRPTLILSIEQGPEFLLDRAVGGELLSCVVSNLPPPAKRVKALFLQDFSFIKNRSEERRVGKECRL